MTRGRLTLLAIWFIGWLVWALLQIGFVEADGYRRDWIVMGAPFPNSITLLVDKSGSMLDNHAYALACMEARVLAAQTSDGARVRFVAFSKDVEYEPQGWIALPDAEALALADAWLRSRSIHELDRTNLSGAMASVLEKDQEQSVGVVIITDAAPDGETAQVAKVVVALNQRRKHAATIGVIAINPDKENNCFGLIVANGAGGSYVRTRTTK